MEQKQNQIQEIIEAAISNLRQVAEVNTIIGTPIISSNGATVLPVSQVTIGFVAGGGEYGNEKILKNSYSTQFAGGTGGGATLTPMGFLVLAENDIKMVKLCEQNNLEKFIDISKDFFERVTEN